DPPALRPLTDEDVGDEVSAEREEDADAEQSALRPAVTEVIGDHRRDGHRAEPVESWQVLLVTFHRFRHSQRPLAAPGNPLLMVTMQLRSETCAGCRWRDLFVAAQPVDKPTHPERIRGSRGRPLRYGPTWSGTASEVSSHA